MKPAAALLATALAAVPLQAAAQAYPSKPLHIVNQFAAGASGDITSRAVAETLSKIVGQPVVVENKPGGAGMVAVAYVAKSAPDGYTMLNATSGLTTMRLMMKNLEVDPIEALAPVTQIGRPITLFVVNAGFPAASLRELIEYARKTPGKVSYGTSGIGSPHHFSGEQIQMLSGARLTHVPYKASAQALLDTVAGQISSTFSIYSVTQAHIQSGKVRPLAIVREERVKQLPDVPTMAEVIPGFEEPPSWTGMFIPVKTPPAVMKRLNGDLVKALNEPELRARLEATGLTVHPGTPEEFAETVRRNVALAVRIGKAAGIKPR